MQCEIFMTILEEAQEAYRSEIVHTLPSNTPDDMESNLEKICNFIEQYQQSSGQYQQSNEQCEMADVSH